VRANVPAAGVVEICQLDRAPLEVAPQDHEVSLHRSTYGVAAVWPLCRVWDLPAPVCSTFVPTTRTGPRFARVGGPMTGLELLVAFLAGVSPV
jgi:hypothetical protein